MVTRVRFPSPAFARSFLAGYSAAGSAFANLPDVSNPKAKASRRSSGVSRTEADW
jgi:hypothetical protein